MGFTTSVDGTALDLTESGGQTLPPGYGIQITNTSVISTKLDPAYRIATTGGGDTTFQPGGDSTQAQRLQSRIRKQ